MNKRQAAFIEKLEKHLVGEVSPRTMYRWLGEIILPALAERQDYNTPGLWLESDSYRWIRSHLSDLKEATNFAEKADLEWYWPIVQEKLDYLAGRKIYRQTLYWLERPLDHDLRRADQWMLSYLHAAEECLQLLSTMTSTNKTQPSLPKINASDLENKSLSYRTTTEIIMAEILELISYYETLEKIPDPPNQYFNVSDVRAVQLNRLERLIKCFKGELFYSISVTFEGLDKFSILLMVD